MRVEQVKYWYFPITVAWIFFEWLYSIFTKRFSLLSKASGFCQVGHKMYGAPRQHCKISPGNLFVFQDLFNILQKKTKHILHESIDESPNITNLYIFQGENEICIVHTFFHVFWKLSPQS
jgi:hypothetical protein